MIIPNYDLIELKTNYNGYIIYFIGYLISETKDYIEIAPKLVFENNGLVAPSTDKIRKDAVIERSIRRCYHQPNTYYSNNDTWNGILMPPTMV